MKMFIPLWGLFIFLSLDKPIKLLNVEGDNLVQTESKAFKLDSLYTSLFENGEFNGNILVAERGTIVFQKFYGLANEEKQSKLNLQTVFELASISKQFTAMGIVLLQKEGKLAYDDLFSNYIPELSLYQGITIRNLLTHTSGLPDYMKLAAKHWDKSKIATNQDIIDLFVQFSPNREFEPNQKWSYSNTGYLLLATIIERVSGMSFEVYLKERIFNPLGMENTFIYRRRYDPKKIPNYAEGYMYSSRLKRKYIPDERGPHYKAVYLDGIVGDGTVNSNLSDLLKWDRALYTNKIVDVADKKEIFFPHTTSEGKNTKYGFGWFVIEDKTFGKMAFHSGSWAGYSTYIGRHLDNDKTIIILQNNSTAKTKMPVKITERILYGLPITKN